MTPTLQEAAVILRPTPEEEREQIEALSDQVTEGLCPLAVTSLSDDMNSEED